MTTQDQFGGSSQQSVGLPQRPPAPAGLSFFGAVARCFKNYANFKDRAARSEYWWFIILTAVLNVAVGVMPETAYTGPAPLVILALIALLVLPTLAVTTRRLHDTGRSGWFQLISFIPLVGPILLIVWLASRGESGMNPWGPEPGTAFVETL